ncbi:hypothetical protein BKA70DRAFT_1298964, partial [Coprinopsis sp. MPI-PUGE-AT-0042]
MCWSDVAYPWRRHTGSDGCGAPLRCWPNFICLSPPFHTPSSKSNALPPSSMATPRLSSRKPFYKNPVVFLELRTYDLVAFELSPISPHVTAGLAIPISRPDRLPLQRGTGTAAPRPRGSLFVQTRGKITSNTRSRLANPGTPRLEALNCVASTRVDTDFSVSVRGPPSGSALRWALPTLYLRRRL